MTRINLLPWREQLRKERERQFYVIAVGAAIFMGLVVLYVHLHIDGMIDRQEARNSFLEQQIDQVDKKIEEIKRLEEEKRKLLARMRIIEQLQVQRPQVVHLFDELVRTLPDGVQLSQVEQTDDEIRLRGKARSNARVSAFMRNLDASQWLDDPRLEVIQGQSGSNERVSEFTLRVKQMLENEDQGDGTGKAQ